MLPEIEFNNRVKGISPSHEQLQHYATIFRASPDLSFSMAYIDGWLAASRLYTQIAQHNDSTLKTY